MTHTLKNPVLVYAGLVLFAFFIFFTGIAYAQNPSDVTFPIPELGNCSSMSECKAFCDDSTNKDACVAWAEGHGISVATEERASVPPQGGPGGCRSDSECRAYCDSDEHIDECLNFGVKEGVISSDEAAKIRSHRDEGGPGGCRGPKECDEFCKNPANQNICIDFAVSKGFMTSTEAEQAKEFLAGGASGIPRPGEFSPQRGPRGPAGAGRPGEPGIDKAKAEEVLKAQGGPGGCKDFNECESFCNNPANSETCFNFAVEHGLMNSADAEKLKKAMNAEGPGG